MCFAESLFPCLLPAFTASKPHVLVHICLCVPGSLGVLCLCLCTLCCVRGVQGVFFQYGTLSSCRHGLLVWLCVARGRCATCLRLLCMFAPAVCIVPAGYVQHRAAWCLQSCSSVCSLEPGVRQDPWGLLGLPASCSIVWLHGSHAVVLKHALACAAGACSACGIRQFGPVVVSHRLPKVFAFYWVGGRAGVRVCGSCRLWGLRESGDTWLHSGHIREFVLA